MMMEISTRPYATDLQFWSNDLVSVLFEPVLVTPSPGPPPAALQYTSNTFQFREQLCITLELIVFIICIFIQFYF